MLAPAAAARMSALRTFDGERQAVVRFERVPVRRLSPAGQGGAMLARVQRLQSALALAEMVGALSLTRGVADPKQSDAILKASGNGLKLRLGLAESDGASRARK